MSQVKFSSVSKAFALVSLALAGYQPAAKAEGAEYCMENVDGDYVCLHHVRGEKRTPHINQVFVSVNGGPIDNYEVNCRNPRDVGDSGSLHEYVCENYTEWDY